MTAYGLAHVHARQARGALEQRVGRDVHARADDAAQVLAARRDGVEGGGRAEVHDDQRARAAVAAAVALVRRHAVDDAIGADLGRARRRAPACRCWSPRPRPAARDGSSAVAISAVGRVSVGTTDASTTASTSAGASRPCWNSCSTPHAHLVRRPLPLRGQPPAVKQPVAVEDADDDVGVADVEGEQHR